MNELKEIYERITLLRQKGVKMKEIAEQTHLTPQRTFGNVFNRFSHIFQESGKGNGRQGSIGQRTDLGQQPL